MPVQLHLKSILKATLLSCVCAASACRKVDSGSQTARAWDKNEAPANVELRNKNGNATSYLKNVKVLFKDHAKGTLDKIPWTDSYWATYAKGLAGRWNFGPNEPMGMPEIKDYKRMTQEEFNQLNRLSSDERLAKLAKLSPAEKYDLYMGNFYYDLSVEMDRRYEFVKIDSQRIYANLKTKEIKNNTSLDDKTKTDRIQTAKQEAKLVEIPKWEGLCNGWAVASVIFEEPKPVILKSYNPIRKMFNGPEIPFGSSDIKALLSYYTGKVEDNGSADDGFAGRNCLKEQIKAFDPPDPEFYDPTAPVASAPKKEAKKGPKLLSECQRLNAGTFHIVLSNFIGIHKRGFQANIDEGKQLADGSMKYEVWNHPVFRYESKLLQNGKRLPKGPKAAATAEYELEVETSIWFRKESNPRYMPRGDDPESIEKKTYHYRLEIDQKDEIVGGEWISKNPPDYVWVDYESRFDEESVKGHRLGLYLLGLKDIYEESLKVQQPRDLTAR